MKVLVVNGPNLNMLGVREPEIYGSESLDTINEKIKDYSQQKGVEVDFVQSNYEGQIIEYIQNAYKKYDGIIINPGAHTHYSLAISDAISGVDIPCVEVHLSNIHSRESFRKNSVIAPKCIGQISGFGYLSYILAIDALFSESQK